MGAPSLIALLLTGYSLFIGLKEFLKAEGVSASFRTIHASKDHAIFTVIIEDSAALVGLSVTFAGSVLDQAFGWYRADGIAPILIGVMLTAVAVLLIIESKAFLVGEGASLAMLREIRALVQDNACIEIAEDPMTMYCGP